MAATKAFGITLLIILILATLQAAAAVPVPATGLTPGESSRRNLSTSDNTNASAVAGNVTHLDINALSITTSWAGYYGNISGNIVLADANNDSFYEWSNGTSISGEVYASRNDTIDWNTINCSNSTHIAQEETYLGQTSGDADSVTNTFNETDHTAFNVGTRNMNGCPSTNAFTSGALDENNWHQIFLSDDQDRKVYTTIINSSTTGYNGGTWDFQLLVAENEKTGSEGTTLYYFFTELA